MRKRRRKQGIAHQPQASEKLVQVVSFKKFPSQIRLVAETMEEVDRLYLQYGLVNDGNPSKIDGFLSDATELFIRKKVDINNILSIDYERLSHSAVVWLRAAKVRLLFLGDALSIYNQNLQEKDKAKQLSSKEIAGKVAWVLDAFFAEGID